MLHDLYTPEGETLQGTPWQVYPRPQLRRESYVNLNGVWELSVNTADTHKILVPFCPESSLSGVKQHFSEGSALFYSRNFSLPAGFRKDRVLLHIGAADQTAEVIVNKQRLGTHEGGYNSFTVDITPALTEGENELVICCTDNLKDQSFPYGKQTLKRGGMWYTPVSGIWQTVWLESVPESYIENLDTQVDLTHAVITTTPALDGKVFCEGKEYPLVGGKAVIIPENPHLWSPEEP